MVRVWAPEISQALDNQRLPAAHAEVHYILGALARGRGTWWLHPETQRWYGREPELRKIHDELAEEMRRRQFNHATPTPGQRAYLSATPPPQVRQDQADLFRKWLTEGRLLRDASGRISHVYLGSAHTSAKNLHDKPIGELKEGRRIYGFRPAPDWLQPFALQVARDGEHFDALFPYRTWHPTDSAALKALVSAEDRGPTMDLSEDETRHLMPAKWSEDKILDVLLDISRRRGAVPCPSEQTSASAERH